MIKSLSKNAILSFGMRMTMKKKGSAVLLSVISGVTTLIFVITVLSMKASGSDVSDFAQAGKVLFYVLMALHMILGVFITPAVAGTAISSEREKQTMDLLLCSQMMPRDVVIGKFLSSISWVMLVSVSLLPSYSVIYMIGGVPARAIIFSLLYIMWLTAAMATFAIFFSSVMRRSAGAVVVTYVVLFGIVSLNFSAIAGYYGLIGLMQSIYNSMHGYAAITTPFDWVDKFICPLAWINPVIGFIVVLVGSMEGVSDIADLLFGMMTNNMTLDAILILVGNLVFYTLIGLFMLRLAARAVDPLRPPRKEEKMRKKQAKAARAARAAEPVQ
ncbi:MAG: ABC transporter permease [Clostridia bacterium]|nr:ABC transporter permease [Clostridia bacterium]